MYFADEHEANASDPVLNLIEWEVRRKTLIAEREVRGTEVVYRFDIHLQGENETVFSIFSRRGDHHLRPGSAGRRRSTTGKRSCHVTNSNVNNILLSGYQI